MDKMLFFDEPILSNLFAVSAAFENVQIGK